MHVNLLRNVPKAAISASTTEIRSNINIRRGLKCGKNASLPVAQGHVLKAGTLLTKSAGILTPHTGFSEQQKLVFDADIIGTAAKKVVFTIAGLTITTTSNILLLSTLFTLLKDAKPGDTGAALLAASGVTGLDSVAGTLGAWYTMLDTVNRTILFVSSAYQTNVGNLTFTLVDTAGSPVDLSSHVTSTNIPLSSADIHGILVNPVNTVSAQKSVPVYTEADFYENILALWVEPDSETDLIDGAVPDLLASGLFSFAHVTVNFLQTEFNAYQAFDSMAS